MSSLGRGFDSVADLYDEVRPDYPDEVFGAIETAAGGFAGSTVLDLAAGTGIAARAMRSRGARVIALDPGEAMLRRLRRMSADVPAVVANAEQLPFAAGRFDLATCATGWHWVQAEQTLAELRRALRPGGHIALWWANNRWGAGVDWEDARRAVYDRWDANHGSRPVAHTGVAPLDAARDLYDRGLTVVVNREVRWTRERTVADHIRAIATHSDVIALGERKQQFLGEMAEALAPWSVVTERLWGPLVVAHF